MFYMFWPDEDLDNEWLDHFIVSYDKEQKIEIICILHLTFLILVFKSDKSLS